MKTTIAFILALSSVAYADDTDLNQKYQGTLIYLNKDLPNSSKNRSHHQIEFKDGQPVSYDDLTYNSIPKSCTLHTRGQGGVFIASSKPCKVVSASKDTVYKVVPQLVLTLDAECPFEKIACSENLANSLLQKLPQAKDISEQLQNYFTVSFPKNRNQAIPVIRASQIEEDSRSPSRAGPYEVVPASSSSTVRGK